MCIYRTVHVKTCLNNTLSKAVINTIREHECMYMGGVDNNYKYTCLIFYAPALLVHSLIMYASYLCVWGGEVSSC